MWFCLSGERRAFVRDVTRRWTRLRPPKLISHPQYSRIQRFKDFSQPANTVRLHRECGASIHISPCRTALGNEAAPESWRHLQQAWETQEPVGGLKASFRDPPYSQHPQAMRGVAYNPHVFSMWLHRSHPQLPAHWQPVGPWEKRCAEWATPLCSQFRKAREMTLSRWLLGWIRECDGFSQRQ